MPVNRGRLRFAQIVKGRQLILPGTTVSPCHLLRFHNILAQIIKGVHHWPILIRTDRLLLVGDVRLLIDVPRIKLLALVSRPKETIISHHFCVRV